MNLMALTDQANTAKETTTAIIGLVKVLQEDKAREDCDNCQPIMGNFERGCLLSAIEHLAQYATGQAESIEDTLQETHRGGVQ